MTALAVADRPARGADTHGAAVEWFTRLLAFAAGLPSEQRQAFVEVRGQGASLRQAAQALGCSHSQVARLLRAAEATVAVTLDNALTNRRSKMDGRLVADLPVQPRTARALARAGIVRVDVLLAMEADALLGLRGFGPTSLLDLGMALAIDERAIGGTAVRLKPDQVALLEELRGLRDAEARRAYHLAYREHLAPSCPLDATTGGHNSPSFDPASIGSPVPHLAQAIERAISARRAASAVSTLRTRH